MLLERTKQLKIYTILKDDKHWWLKILHNNNNPGFVETDIS